LWVLAGFAVVSMQGCLPPDWSFCDCDFRDNFWNHVLNDVHMLWNTADFVSKARDNTTFQGRYLQAPPEGLDCPEMANVFWKAWPRMGMSRGLIEGSMGDLWMPAARDRIKGMCMAGHLGLTLICSQHFLVKAARGIEAGEEGTMKYLEAAYSHMVSMRNMGKPYQLRNCMGQQGWSINGILLTEYAEKWLGPENLGTTPVAAYLGGKLDPFQMLFDKQMAHTPRTRKDSLPDRRPCVPLKDPKCWKRMSKLLVDTCEHCCSPFIHKSGRGDPWCFDSVYTYERCCNEDFKDLVCELKRKGEEGGCVDCKKTVSYVCLTPPEKKLQDAQNTYNDLVDRFNRLKADTERLTKEIADARADLVAKNDIHVQKYEALDLALRIWSTAFNNGTRLISEGRLKQQRETWNNSALAHTNAVHKHKLAQEALRNVTGVLQEARRSEAQAQQVLKRNESMHSAAVTKLEEVRQRLRQAQAAQAVAGSAATVADEEAARAIMAQALAERLAVAANRSREEVNEDTACEFEDAGVSQRMAEAMAKEASESHDEAEASARLGRDANSSAHAALASAVEAVLAAERFEDGAIRALEVAVQALREAERRQQQHELDLDATSNTETWAHDTLLNRTRSSEAVRCLISRTPANASERPLAYQEALQTTCAALAAPKDKNDFCKSWAEAGECQRNPVYMRRICSKSCLGKVGSPEPVATPICTADNAMAAEKVVRSDIAGSLGEEGLDKLVREALAAVDASGVWEDPVGEATNLVVDMPDVISLAEVDAATHALQKAREVKDRAVAHVADTELALQAAQQAERDAVAREGEAHAAVGYVEASVAAAEEVERLWRGLEAGNVTATAGAAKAFEDRLHEQRRLTAAATEAGELKTSLDATRRLAEDDVAVKLDAQGRAGNRVRMLTEHVETLNASLAENLTTAVADWLHAKEEKEALAASGAELGWARRLVLAAKSAIVSVVGSIEVFLDTYVMSMSDREVVLELVRASEDRKMAEQRLRDAEVAADSAQVQAQDARSSVARAESARLTAEEAVERAVGAVRDAEAVMRAAGETLNATRRELEASHERLQAERRALDERKGDLLRATAAREASTATVAESQNELRRCHDAVEAASSGVVEAAAVLEAEEAAVMGSRASAMDAYFGKLRQQCGATSAEVEAYMQDRPLLSLLRAATVARERALVASRAAESGAASNRSAAEAARRRAHEGLQDARAAHRICERDAASASAELSLRVELLAEREVALASAQAALGRAKERMTLVSDARMQADADATAAIAVHINTGVAASEAERRRSARAEELRLALNATHARLSEEVQAEVGEAEAARVVEVTKLWLSDFTTSLQLGVKNRSVELATELEIDRRAAGAAAKRLEARHMKLLKTHERRLQLVDAQVELVVKDKAQATARTEHAAAEKTLLDAQTKLDTLVKTDAETNKNLHETYGMVNKKLEEYHAAKDEYEKQDPKDRERSFSTSLSGSGPDPNGVDIR